MVPWNAGLERATMEWIGVCTCMCCVCVCVWGGGGGRCNYLGSSWKDRWLQLQSHSAPTPSSPCRGTLKTAPLTPSSLTSTPSRLPSSPSAGAQGLACTLSPSQGLSLSPCHRGQAEAQQGSAGAGSPPQAVCCHHPHPPPTTVPSYLEHGQSGFPVPIFR